MLCQVIVWAFAVLIFCVPYVVNLVPEFCNVEVYPNSVSTIVGDTFYYSCQGWNSEDNVTVKWLINDTIIVKNLSNIVIPENHPRTARYLKIVNATMMLNNTDISCSVRYPTNQCTSEKSKLLIQGNPTEVSDFHVGIDLRCSSNGTIYMNWTQPHTLDLSFYEDSINYTIEIAYDSSSKPLVEENITTSSFMSVLPEANLDNASCNFLNIAVIPFNLVGEGIPTMTTETPLTTGDISIMQEDGVYVGTNYSLFVFEVNPAVCDVEIMLTDIDTAKQIHLPSKNVVVMNNCSFNSIVTISTLGSGLIENQHYNATYFLTNSDGFNMSNVLSTFDIQDIKWINQDNGSIKFLENSTAVGALLLLSSLENNTIFFIALNRLECDNISLISLRAKRILAVYDIEANGKLLSGKNMPAIQPHHIDLNNTNYYTENFVSKQTNVQKCALFLFMNAAVTINCECTKSIDVVKYQVLLLLQNATNGIIYANSGRCASEVTVPVDKIGLYYVVVFFIDQANGITESAAYFAGNIAISDNLKSANSVTTLVTTLTLIVIILLAATLGQIIAAIVCAKLHKKKIVDRSKKYQVDGIRNPIYEEESKGLDVEDNSRDSHDICAEGKQHMEDLDKSTSSMEVIKNHFHEAYEEDISKSEDLDVDGIRNPLYEEESKDLDNESDYDDEGYPRMNDDEFTPDKEHSNSGTPKATGPNSNRSSGISSGTDSKRNSDSDFNSSDVTCASEHLPKSPLLSKITASGLQHGLSNKNEISSTPNLVASVVRKDSGYDSLVSRKSFQIKRPTTSNEIEMYPLTESHKSDAYSETSRK